MDKVHLDATHVCLQLLTDYKWIFDQYNQVDFHLGFLNNPNVRNDNSFKHTVCSLFNFWQELKQSIYFLTL